MESFKLLMNSIMTAGLVCFQLNHAAASSITIDFDHLASLPAVTAASSFAAANGGSLTTQGVTFASSFEVVGDQYRINGSAPNPTLGVPTSGHYFLSNGNTPNDNLLIQTTLVLTEAWFGRNEYYGYGGGATSVTVTAFGSSGDLGSETTLLPDTYPYTGNLPGYSIGNGLPDPLVQLDTSSFLGLSGITGYRISRVELGTFNGNWIGDDFTFTSASTVPEPTGFALFGVGLLGMTYMLRRQKLSSK